LEPAGAGSSTGRAEIARQRASIGDTEQHLSEISRWIAESERLINGQRKIA
jgi:hypothetical protein